MFGIKKLRLYLDTSVISCLDQQDAPERMAETHELWRKIKIGEFDAVLSNITENEIRNCAEPKRSTLFGYLGEISYETIAVNDKTFEVASRFVDLGILRQKSFDDCQHIAAAIVGQCDAIVSWNFKHIVNHKTVMGAKAVTALEGYDDILIYSPSMLAGGEEA